MKMWLVTIYQGSKVDFYETSAPDEVAAERHAREQYGRLLGPRARITAEEILASS